MYLHKKKLLFVFLLVSVVCVLGVTFVNCQVFIEKEEIISFPENFTYSDYLFLLKQYEQNKAELKYVITSNSIIYYEYKERIDNVDYVSFKPYKLTYIDKVFLHNPSYGEDSTSLGQFVDNYVDMDNVSVADDVVCNSTYNALELNWTFTATVLEDFTTYTEVDEDADMTVTVNKIDVSSMRRDAGSYVYYDFGIGFLTNFSVDFSFNVTDVEAGDASWTSKTGFMTFSNVINNLEVIRSGDMISVILQENQAVDDDYGFYLRQFDAGVGVVLEGSTTDFFTVGDPILYCTLFREGTNLTVEFYNDTARTRPNRVLKYSSNSADTVGYRYFFPLNNWNKAVDGANHWTGWLDNVSFTGLSAGYELDGYVITTNYLNNSGVDGSVLVQMFNVTHGSDTILTVQFSDDNSTWVNSAGVTGYDNVVAGMSSVDLRNLNYTSAYYLMYNFSTANVSQTPRLYQSRLISTESGVVSSSAGGEEYIPIGVALGLCIGIAVMIVGVKK